MWLKRLSKRAFGWFARPFRAQHTPEARLRGPRTHVIILDGTLSSLERGFETHAGVTYRLCREMGSDVSVYYDPMISKLIVHDEDRPALFGHGVSLHA